MMHKALLPLTLGLLTSVSIAADPVAAPPTSTAEQVVDAFSAIYGAHPGARVNHAKGVIK